jgi:hypothetical protein
MAEVVIGWKEMGTIYAIDRETFEWPIDACVTSREISNYGCKGVR